MTIAGAPLLEVHGLKTYFYTDEGIVRAVDGVSFDVVNGKTLGVVGESGCGKSVTAMSILGIVDQPGRIVGGEILLHQAAQGGHETVVNLAQMPRNGKEIRGVRGREIALVFQEPMTSLSPVHTIGQQIEEMILLHNDISAHEAHNRAIEALRSVGIPRAEQRIGAYAYQLSGGLRQRAMIAMALSCNPRLLIADEPTTALDVTTQAQILALLGDLQQERGMAIMLITHNLGVIAEMADDVVVMYLGLAVETGPVKEIFHNARHPYTRALLRSIPSIESMPRVKLPTISGTIPHPYNRPSGCPFHPRCPSRIKGVCDQKEPRLTTVGQQQVSCFLYDT